MNVATPEDRAKIKQYLNEALKATIRKQEEQAGINDILKVLKEDHDIQPKIARKIIAAMKKGNMPEIKQENDDFEDLYEIVQ